MQQASSLIFSGVGAALPRTCVTNAQLVAQLAATGVATTEEWITSRTGITQRYVCQGDENTATLAAAAAAQALAHAGLTVADVGLIVVATCTPSRSFPSTAAIIHGSMGFATSTAALDVNAACSGFIYGLAVAQGMLHTGTAQHALVIGAEAFSTVIDWSDRSTCVLFGDGAGAVVLSKSPQANTGMLALSMGTQGALADVLTSSPPGLNQGIHMQGAEVFKQAVKHMGTAPAIVQQAGYTVQNIDWCVPHQANARILSAAANSMGMPFDKVVQTVAQHANTSAASIPLALSTAVGDGRIQRGHLLLLQAFGAGLTSAECLVRY
jgi:3-oxoacyl-[acyl-carrier-protein] synthase-3